MKLKVPTALEDISLEQVQRVLLIDRDKEIEDLSKRIHSVAIMCKATPDQVALLNLGDLDLIYDRLNNLINGELDCELNRFVKYLGREYAFIEDVRDMETGAFVDIDKMSGPETYADNLHNIMAILYRPIDKQFGDQYKLKSYVLEDPQEREERRKIFLKYMTLREVRGAATFFLRGMQKSLNISDGSFPKIPSLTVEGVMRGVGITSFTELVESHSPTSIKSSNRELVKP